MAYFRCLPFWEHPHLMINVKSRQQLSEPAYLIEQLLLNRKARKIVRFPLLFMDLDIIFMRSS